LNHAWLLTALLCLHVCASPPQVTEGVYHHNVHGAAAAVAAGKADPSDFRFFAQYAGWAPGQLEEECKSGVWFCTAASPALTLNAELSNGRAMWHAVLQVMGGECYIADT
jgi:putative transcriptional regulator